MEDKKVWYKSKTVLLNVLGIIVMVIPVLSDYEIVKPEVAGLIIGVANVILRFFSPKDLVSSSSKL